MPKRYMSPDAEGRRQEPPATIAIHESLRTAPAGPTVISSLTRLQTGLPCLNHLAHDVTTGLRRAQGRAATVRPCLQRETRPSQIAAKQEAIQLLEDERDRYAQLETEFRDLADSFARRARRGLADSVGGVA